MSEFSNIKRSFLFFDYETFGTDPKRDVPAEFGAIRTDENFNPIGEPVLLHCLTPRDYLPSPEACFVTGLTPLSLMDDGFKENEFASRIYEMMSQPGTITVGYNNIKFDEEVTRFMFWKNLLPVYDREFGEGRGRFDTYTLVRAVYAFCPETLQWPRREDGAPVLRLEKLTAENGIVHDHAHNALSDALATKELTKLIASRQPKLWLHALDLRDKRRVKELLGLGQPLLYVNPFAGKSSRGLSVVFPLFASPANPNDYFCWDLTKDPSELWTLTSKDLEERFYVTKEQREAGVERVPLLKIQINKQPFLTTGLGWLDGRGKGLFSLPASEFRFRANELAARSGDFSQLHGLVAEMSSRSSERFESEDLLAEGSLYSGGFLGEGDKRTLSDLRKLSPNELPERLAKVEFSREDLNDLVFHYMARNFAESTLSFEDAERWTKFRFECLVQGKGGSRTFEKFYEEIEKLREGAAEEQIQILEDLQSYGEDLMSDFN